MKTLVIVLGGVFVGVVVAEIIKQSNPECLKGVENKAREFVNSFKSAFKEGYEGASA